MAILEPLLSLMFRVKVLRMERRGAIGGKWRAGGGRGREVKGVAEEVAEKVQP